MKNYNNIVLIMILLGFSFSVHALDFVSHDFDDGDLGPFYVCTTQNPNYTRVENGRLKTWWTETGYNGTRMDKGAEACADWDTRKEGWMGFTMNFGSDYPTDKTASIAQIFQFYSSSFWSWAALINIIDGDLQITHRSNGGTSGNTDVVVYSDFPKETDMDIIIHFILSHENNGLIQIWVNGVSHYYADNINFGYAEGWTDDEQTSEYSYVNLKIGQYNYDDSHYDTDETRTVYYDNVTWYAGSNGYSIVDPTGGSCSDGANAFSTIEVEDYCAQSGIQTEACSEGTLNVGWINNGDWCAYYNVDFGGGVNTFQARVASAAAGGDIEIRLDSVTGLLVGTCSVANTGGNQSWATNTTVITDVSGVHDLYLVFTGIGTGYLFNVNNFSFVQSADGDLTFDGKVNLEDIAELSVGWQFDYAMDDLLEIVNNWLNGTDENTITIQENETGYCSADGTIDDNNEGFTGTGFVNTTNATGTGVDWSINGSAGPYTITWRYAVQGDARPANLIVDGSTVSGNIAFFSTGSWTVWDTQTVNVTLSAGIKSVRLEATGSSGLGNIDYIEITGPGAAAAGCN